MNRSFITLLVTITQLLVIWGISKLLGDPRQEIFNSIAVLALLVANESSYRKEEK